MVYQGIKLTYANAQHHIRISITEMMLFSEVLFMTNCKNFVVINLFHCFKSDQDKEMTKWDCSYSNHIILLGPASLLRETVSLLKSEITNVSSQQ